MYNTRNYVYFNNGANGTQSNPIISALSTQVDKGQQEQELKEKERRRKVMEAYQLLNTLKSPEKQFCGGYMSSGTCYSGDSGSTGSSCNDSGSTYNSRGIATPR
jgi:hypothetical protein